jgi:CRP-like cAMP-binding protein
LLPYISVILIMLRFTSGLAVPYANYRTYQFRVEYPTPMCARWGLPNARRKRQSLNAPESNIAENQLLTAIPRAERQHLLAGCELVELKTSEVIYEPRQRIRYVYFPINSFVSYLATADGSNRLEVGMAGNEGMVGTSLILGIDIAQFHVLVQGAGSAWRMKATQFKEDLAGSIALQRRLQRYLYVVMSQIAQTAACTRFHLVEQRVARWLLMTQDRAHSDQLHLTQQFLSNMLGVRRVGISNAATSLHQRNLITYSRGQIKILDRPGLIAASCQCYQADKEHYAHMLK